VIVGATPARRHLRSGRAAWPQSREMRDDGSPD
jgi:hypothetical protein